jgi:hypothetical protein
MPSPSPSTTGPLEDNSQAPLGSEPAYDDVLDAAVEYTFPCSDPIAVDACCARRRDPRPAQAAEPAAMSDAGRPA